MGANNDYLAFNDNQKKDVRDIVDSVVKADTEYKHVFVTQWVDKINEDVIKKLVSYNKPYKYIAFTVIAQNKGSGLHTSSSCYWEPEDKSYMYNNQGK
ncbi:dynein light chain, partial [Acrasis kona]